jgi:hypothetical protein
MAEQMKEKKPGFCPLDSGECQCGQEMCAWWAGDRCAVLVLAGAFCQALESGLPVVMS